MSLCPKLTDCTDTSPSSEANCCSTCQKHTNILWNTKFYNCFKCIRYTPPTNWTTIFNNLSSQYTQLQPNPSFLHKFISHSF